MKAIYTFTLLIVFQFAVAQDIDSTIVFETEQVPEFKKQTILEEYQVPYKQDTERKRLLRLGIEENRLSLSPMFIDFAQKVGKQYSIILGLSYGSDEIARSLINYNIEFRRFLGMKHRIVQKKQKNNFNGNYVSFAYKQNNVLAGINDVSSTLLGSTLNSRAISGKNAIVGSFGTQLGGFLDFALQAGVRGIIPSSIDNEGLIIHDGFGVKQSYMPFIGTRSSISFSFGKKKDNDNCDFVNCYREVSQLFKLSVGDLFYLDTHSAHLNLNLDYENRIMDSPFTLNSRFRFSGGLRSEYKKTGNTVEVLKEFIPGVDVQVDLPTYHPGLVVRGSSTLRFQQDVRFYATQQRNIASGKSAKNLNGFYLYGGASLNIGSVEIDNFAVVSQVDRVYYRIGGGLGSQKIVGSKYFTDFSLGFYPITNLSRIDWANLPVQLGFKFGFAKQPNNRI